MGSFRGEIYVFYPVEIHFPVQYGLTILRRTVSYPKRFDLNFMSRQRLIVLNWSQILLHDVLMTYGSLVRFSRFLFPIVYFLKRNPLKNMSLERWNLEQVVFWRVFFWVGT